MHFGFAHSFLYTPQSNMFSGDGEPCDTNSEQCPSEVGGQPK